MAKLITCPTCKNQISSDAKTCPKCGKKDPNNMKGKGCLLIIFIFIVGLIYVKCSGKNHSTESAESTAIASTSTETTSGAAPITSAKEFNPNDTFDIKSDQFVKNFNSLMAPSGIKSAKIGKLKFKLNDKGAEAAEAPMLNGLYQIMITRNPETKKVVGVILMVGIVDFENENDRENQSAAWLTTSAHILDSLSSSLDNNDSINAITELMKDAKANDYKGGEVWVHGIHLMITRVNEKVLAVAFSNN